MGTVEVWQCSCQHLQADIMRVLLILAVIGSALGARKLQSSKPREEKSLLNTFPFNARDSEHDHQHHNERRPSVQLPAVNANQGRRGGNNRRPSSSDSGGDGVSFGDVASANPGRDGKRCIDKVEMIEETEYDEVVECETIQDEKCQDETSGYTSFTKCSKWPRELCAPAGCGFKEGSEVCYDKTQTVVQDAPK